MEYSVIIKDVGDGWYMGQCEQVPGAITQGASIDEVKENIKEAITLVLETEKAHCQKMYEGDKYMSRTIAV